MHLGRGEWKNSLWRFESIVYERSDDLVLAKTDRPTDSRMSEPGNHAGTFREENVTIVALCFLASGQTFLRILYDRVPAT